MASSWEWQGSSADYVGFSNQTLEPEYLAHPFYVPWAECDNGPMAWPRKKQIFTVLIERRSPERANSVRDNKLAGYISKESQESYKIKHPLNRYNNLVGFAEIYWDLGTRIDIDYYFLGNRTTKAGKRLVNHLRASGHRYYELDARTYYSYWSFEVGSILPRVHALDKRKEVNHALDHVEQTANELGVYVDLSHERGMVEYLDVDRFFSGGTFDA